MERDSPAHTAGVQRGDIMIAYNSHTITGIDTLHRLLTETQVGIASQITVLRRAKKKMLEVIPTESP